MLRTSAPWLVLGILNLSLCSIGCGNTVGISGSGGGVPAAADSQTPAASPQGKITLPAGFPIGLGNLNVVTGAGNVSVGSDGAFQLPSTSGELTLVCATDATGKTILLALAKGDSATVEVSPTSTAVALLFFALGGPFLDDSAAQIQLLNRIQSDPSLQPLLAKLLAKLSQDATVVSDSDPELETALVNARLGLLAGLPVTPRAFNPSGADLIRPRLAQFTINPDASSPQSGTSLSLDVDSGIVATNTFRRLRSELFAYEVATTDTGGTRTEFPKAILKQGPLGLSGSYAVTSISDLAVGYAGLLFHQDPLGIGATDAKLDAATFAPDTSDPKIQKTHFQVVQLSPYLTGLPFSYPAFFSQAKYSDQVQTWKDRLTTVECQEFVVDVLLPVVNLVVGQKLQKAIGKLDTLEGNRAFVGALSSMIAGLPPNIVGQIISGTPQDWGSAATALYGLIGKGQLPGSLLNLGLSIGVDSHALASKTFGQISLALFALGVGINAVDIARAGFDISQCHAGETWDVTADLPPDPPPSPNPGHSTYSGEFVLTRQNFSVDGGAVVPGSSGSFTYTMNAHLVFHNGLIIAPAESTVTVTPGGGTLTEPLFQTQYQLVPGLITMTVKPTFTHGPNEFSWAGGFSINATTPSASFAQFEFDSGTSGIQLLVTDSSGHTTIQSGDVFMGSQYGFATALNNPLTRVPFDPGTDTIQGTTLQNFVPSTGTQWTLVIPTMHGSPNP